MARGAAAPPEGGGMTGPSRTSGGAESGGAGQRPPSLSVAVIGICGAPELRRCLAALAAQEGAGRFEVVVAYDPELPGLAAVAEELPEVRMVANEGQRSPLELASRAIRESTGEVVLLTEDHCLPDRRWVAELAEQLLPGRAAAGGSVAVEPGADALAWAFYFVDYFRYAEPLAEGPAPSLTVCNVAYRRRDLDAVGDVWRGLFHETAVHEALRHRYGDLWRVPRARVTIDRRPGFAAALAERYAFGRLYGATRRGFTSPAWRLAYTLLAPALPALLFGRMAAKALGSRRLRRPFLSALGHLVALVAAWSWGEWLGHLTGRRPRDLTVAPSRPRR